MFAILVAISLLAINDSVDVAPDGSNDLSRAALPVWWNRDALPEIESPADCARHSRAWLLSCSQSDADISLQLTMPDGSKVVCRDMGRWSDARERGGYAAATVDIVLEGHFRQRDLAYSTIPMLEPARRSGFAGVPWRDIAPSLISEDDHCARGQRVERAMVEWEFEPNLVRYADEESFAAASVLARGDYDGDGWEDWVVSRSGGYQQGSKRYFEELLFTRRPGGRIIDISPRLLLGMPSKEELARFRSGLAASFGLPEGVEIVLEGTLESDDRPLEIQVRLTVQDSFVAGSYCYSRTGKPIPIEGTLGGRRCIELAEYALDAQKNATFALEWEMCDGSLRMKGHWFEATRAHAVELAGALPPAAQIAR